MAKPRIAHLAGPNATIQNTPPLVTSNKARARHGLPLLTDGDGAPARFDALRTQRLAAPATVYVEQFSAHPLERDAAELYAPPDGYLDSAGEFHEKRRNPDDKPVYRIEVSPEDGLYPLPLYGTPRPTAAPGRTTRPIPERRPNRAARPISRTAPGCSRRQTGWASR